MSTQPDPKSPIDQSASIDWTTGDEPMTSEQTSELQALCEQAGEPNLLDASLSKAEAQQRIDELREMLGVG